MGNLTAATALYNEVAAHLGTTLYALSGSQRVTEVQRWLTGGQALAERLRRAGINNSSYTNLNHQAIWLGVFNEWRAIAGV